MTFYLGDQVVEILIDLGDESPFGSHAEQ